MQHKDMEQMLPDFTDLMLETYSTKQEEFKALTVQKTLNILEKRKLDTNLAKTPEFWQRVNSNLELFKMRVIDEINNVIKADFTPEQKQDYLFEYFDKNTNS